MTINTETITRTPVAYAVEGHPDLHELEIHTTATAVELLDEIRSRHPNLEVAELEIEDEQEVIGGHVRLVERIKLDFKLVHASRGGALRVGVGYEGRELHREFRPGATVRAVIEWAISKHAFDLLEGANKFVLKMGDRPLEPETHLGQLVCGPRELALTLVHARKAQG